MPYIEQAWGREPVVIDENGARYSIAQWQAMNTPGTNFTTTPPPYRGGDTVAGDLFPAFGTAPFVSRCDCFACRRYNDTETLRRQAAFSERLRFEQKASEKARALLLAWLSDKQRNTLTRYGFFEVTGSRGNTYRILPGVTFNVQLMRGGVANAAYCAAPRGVPEADVHLAQALALMSNERAFLDVANRA